MATNAILYRMPFGIPGDVTRQSQSTIEPQLFNSAAAFSAYGLFGKIASGRFVPIGTGDAATAVYGLLVRPFPTQSASTAMGVAQPPTTGPADVLRRGYAAVKLRGSAAAALNGQVYVRVANGTTDQPIGGIEAAADSTNTIAVANCVFMSAADADGNVEISFKV